MTILFRVGGFAASVARSALPHGGPANAPPEAVPTVTTPTAILRTTMMLASFVSDDGLLMACGTF